MLYVSLIVCAVLAAMLVYRYDMYEREPWYMLVAAGLLGMGAMALIGRVEAFTLGLIGPDQWSDIAVSAVAATHEELARLLVVAAIALVLPGQFNDPMDGIIYGSIVGLGMAVDESLFFLGLWDSDGPLLPATEIIRLTGHLVLGGITGFAIGMARMSMPRWPAVLAGCLTVSIGLHFLWDWIAFSASRVGVMAWWQTLGAIAVMLSGIYFYGMLAARGSHWSQKVFAPDDPQTLWRWPFTLLKRH